MRILHKFRINEISAVGRPAQEGALALIRKSFNASGRGRTHDRLRALYDDARRGNPQITSDAAFAMAWNSLKDEERDAIRREELAAERENQAQNEARRRAEKGNSDMQNIDRGALAMLALNGLAKAMRDERPDLSEAQAFAKVYSDPANRELASIERGANRIASAPVTDIRTAIAKRDNAMATLQAKAAELRKAQPELSEAQAFAKIYRANPSLAAQERTAAREAIYA